MSRTPFRHRFLPYFLARSEQSALVELRSNGRMPILPTRFGVSVFFVLVVMFIWSANHQLNLGYALTFLVLMMALMSSGFTVAQLSRLEVKALAGNAVWLGEEAMFYVDIVEHQGKTRARVEVKSMVGRGEILDIPAHGQVRAHLFEPTSMRGYHHLNIVELASQFPLGMFETWQWLNLEAKVLVYPKPEGSLPLPMAWTQGYEQSALGGLGEEDLSGLRPFVLGDSLSRVAWKNRGRGGGWLVKQFEGSGSLRMVLDFAQTEGDVEKRLSQMAAWVVEAHREQAEYSLRLPTQEIPFGSGEEHYHRCLSALALYT
ncbi:MAG: DUF58 domain-containing protein [Cardiobacteriaceae bacterium]|nr:DUF58 domain-containing protein [Cardiobacteriaceae bacterium]